MINNLFAIGHHDARFYGYFLDTEGFLWSTKNGSLRKISKSRSKLNNHSVNIPMLISTIMRTPRWNDFLEMVKKTADPKSEKAVPVKRGVFVIALLDENGTPKFSTAPKVHAVENDAITEVKRLAEAFTGKRFAYFKCMGVAVANGVTWA